MAIIKRNSDYALRSLSFMARFPKDERLTLEMIAKNEDVPIAFLRKIFQKLSRARVLQSQRGRCGGFSLLKKPSQINLREVLEFVQGECNFSDCLFDKDMCKYLKTCRVRKELSTLQKRLDSLLESYTLQDFVDGHRNLK